MPSGALPNVRKRPAIGAAAVPKTGGIVKRAFILHLKSQDMEGVTAKVEETKVVIQGKFNPFEPGELYKEIDKAMTSFDADQDYVVPVGSLLISFLSGFWLGQKNPKRLRLMIHDVKTNRYREVVFRPEDLSR